MAGIKGTNVNAPVVPFDTSDQHPSHEARYGKGGYRTVATTVERDAIPVSRREAGMLVYVEADGKAYKLLADLTSWEEFKSGASTWEELAGKPSTFPPSSHAASHGQGGSDPITVAASQISGGSLPQNAVLDFNDGTSDSEIGGWGFGVETGGGSEYATVTATGIVIHGQTSSTTINPAGITFADGSQQTIAWTGSYSHTHDDRYYTESEVDTLLAGKATPGDVTAAVAAVVNAAPAALDTLNELAAALGNDASFATTVTNALAGKAAAVHTHVIADVTGLQTALDGKQASGSYAAAVHTHGISDVTGLQTALDGKQAAGSYAAAVHGHAIADVTGLQTALDGKQAAGSYAAAVHTHGISDVTGLQTALDGKAASSHTHTASQITDFTAAVVAAAPPTTDASLLTTGTLSASRLPSTSVTPGSYGSASAVATYTVDATGRLTAAGSTSIAIAAGAVSGLAAIATSGSASDLGAGTVPVARLPLATTVAAGAIIVGSGLAVSSGTVSVVTYDVRSDTVSSTSYIGRAVSGSATSASVWTIRRTVLTSAGAVSSTTTATNVKWDDRLTASYS